MTVPYILATIYKKTGELDNEIKHLEIIKSNGNKLYIVTLANNRLSELKLTK